jgi:hypothetical protein
MSFVLFAIIVVFTAVQTFVLRDRDRSNRAVGGDGTPKRRGALLRALRIGNQPSATTRGIS